MRVSTIDGLLRGGVQPGRAARLLDAEVARASVMAGLFGGPDGLYRLGRYRLRRTLGEGAHGQVFAGWDPELEREVAIKIVRDNAGDAQRFRDRTAREARALAKVMHPNVVEVYDVGIHDDAVFIVMELVDGEDLGCFVARTRPGLDEVLALFDAAGRGLAAAHGMGLVHRDFKPSNVLVADGKVKVADFGLVHADTARTNEDDLVVTQPGAGTPLYMAPEQHRGLDIDARADQFAFCVALWEAIAGAPPFAGTRASALLEAKLTGIDDRSPAPFSRRLVAVLRRGLQSDPARRFRSMDDLLAAMRRARSRRLGPWSVGVGAITIGIVALVAAPGGTKVSGCEREPPWDAGRHDAIVEAFAGAREQSTRVTATLDAYAQRWSDARRSACATTDAAHARAAVHCLGTAAVELDALASALEDPDDAVIGNANVAAIGLPDPDACLDLREQDHLGATDPAHEAIDLRVARSRALLRAAKLDDALAEGQRAAADAAQLDARAQVPALYQLGHAHEQLEHLQEAEEALGAAYFLAEAHAMEAWAAAAAVRVAAVMIVRRDRARAETWLRHGEAALERAGHPPAHEAAYLGALATHLTEGAQWSEALVRIDEALALADDPPTRAGLLSTRARIHEETGDLAAAEQDLVDARRIEEQLFGTAHPQLARTVLHLGNVQFQQGHAERARATVEPARTLVATAYGPESPAMARVEESLGMIAHALDELDDAVAHHEHALAIRRATMAADHPDIAYSLYNIALVELQRDELASAIARLEESLRILESTFGQEHPRLAHVLSALGSAYPDTGHHEAAIATLRRADAIKTAAGARPEDRAETLRHLALALVASGAPTSEVDAVAQRARAFYREADPAFADRGVEFERELAEAR